MIHSSAKNSLYDRIYNVVRRIPRGRVASYGQIAAYTGQCTPRQAGYAMAALRDDSVPWHRVINSQGRISFPENSPGAIQQRQLLEEEGVEFDRTGRIDLKRFGWRGP
jgi:methylated-DNA-protein-cysteine methyltransferase-like protein